MEIRYRGRNISDEEITFLRQLIAENPTESRRRLSVLVCQAWDWRQQNGAWRDMVCRGLMLLLHRQGLIELPPRRFMPSNPFLRRKKPALVGVLDESPVDCRLAELGPLSFLQVRRRPEEALFNGLIERYHYLGYTQPVGEHLKFLVSGRNRPLACFSFSSAPRHLGPRDRFIGWTPELRRQNIHLIAYNSRFLILPWVSVRYLASHLLARAARRLASEWEALYCHPVYFVETFVDPSRFKGTCYKAANWQVLGRTTGRGKDAPTRRPTRSVKEVLGFPLVKDFRERLCGVAQ